MFEDFHPAANNVEARKRARQSLAAACFLYGGLFGGMVAATATARQVIEEELTQVEFAPPPEPEPEPEPPPPAATPEVKNLRPKMTRPKLTPPDKVSDEKLKESDKELAAADEAGPVDGFLDGVEGGQGSGRPPPPPPPKVSIPFKPPVAFPSNVASKPRYSSKAKRKGVEGVVVVSFEVTATGTVKNVKIVSGAPELVEMVMKWVPNWRFKPAMRDGKAIAYRKTESIRFRLEDA
jgi:periplasmic protein TonB